MKRRPAALPPDGLEHLAERPGRDQPGDGLVLEERLPADVLDYAKEQDRDSGSDRHRAEDPGEGELPETRHRSAHVLGGSGDPAPLDGLGHET